MPKKHQRFHAKPANLAHHSLAPSGSRHDGGSGAHGSASATSVNDLISHLRRTQIPSASSDDPPSSQRAHRSFVASRSVHPSLRDVLELPATAPPRPRPGPRRTIFGDQDQIEKENPGFNESGVVDADSKIVRLDLGNALGNWITLKQLTNEMLLSPTPAMGIPGEGIEEAVPASWDEAVHNGKGEATLDHLPAPSIPKAITQTLRFPELRALSLAHPKRSAASWTGLLNLLGNLPTLTHLSLAHWPIPCRNPRAATARIRGSAARFLTPDALDNNWAEAASVLRQLSRSTYCLKWLDLEGCGEWLPALKWVDEDPDGFPQNPDNVGPEWNGSWRDVEWLGIGPGFMDSTKSHDSCHAPFHEVPTPHTSSSDSSIHATHLQNARDVMRHLRQIRRGRKWLEIELGLGLEDVEPEMIRLPDGQELSVY
ncbi:unnamed protein product [Penicillium palitans]